MERLQQQIQFLVEIDRLKQIFRQSSLMDGSRLENDAEHSWHFAMMALILAEHAKETIDLNRVLRMALIHDIVEIDAGDSFVYDDAAMATKTMRELVAAERIFNLLPDDQAREIRALWDEFEEQETPEARFAGAIDRLCGLLSNYQSGGGGWKRHNISASRIRQRNSHITEGAPALWDLAQEFIADAVKQGWIEE
ncbi:MAG TPA: HD domain-containing protein [Abditibacteriaceae bacterium]